MTEHGHGNRIPRRLNPNPPPVVRKVPASSVPYGPNISRNGQHVWIALEGERIVCVAATAKEARHKFKEIQHALEAKQRGRVG